MASIVPGFDSLSKEDQDLASMLIKEDQGHLFSKWQATGDKEKINGFFEQIRGLERGYPGGVAAYLKNAKTLLKSSAAGDNPFEGMKPEVPHGVSLDYGTPQFIELEEKGVAVFRDCAFVLVAGGLGERLGYSGIKVELPVETVTGRCYLQLYCQQILAMQEYSNKLAGAAPGSRVCPLVIMTSDDTHQKTVRLLESNGYFGMAPGQVVILKQEKVAALLDNDAHIAPAENGDAYSIDTKPHGHGDVHTLLASSGLAKKWADEGRKFVIFFQDTNSLAFTVTQAAIGVSITQGFEVNSIAVPRKAKDAVGAITKLVKEDGSSITVNVEYNQLEPLLKASGAYPEGDVNDPSTGFSPFPGNINQLIFAVPQYAAVLARTGGLVPEFVNPKYADASKTKFKKPTRLECMMQDHPKVLGPESKVGFTTFPEWTYSPVKNSVDEARAKIAVGAPGRTAAEGELEYYSSAVSQLASIGVPKPTGGEGSLNVFGFSLKEPAHLVLYPSFAPTYNSLKAHFPTPERVHISSRSTVVIEGANVVVESMDVDGALVIRGSPAINPDPAHRIVIKSLKVHNGGWKLQPLSEEEQNKGTPAGGAIPDSIRIRGFKVEKGEARVIEIGADASADLVIAE